MRVNKIYVVLLLLLQGTLGAQSVEELVALAKEYNPGLKAMKMEYEAAKLKSDQVRDWPDPVVNLGVGVLPIETRLGAQRLKIGVSQMIPWKGLLDAKSRVESSKAEVKSHMDEVKEIHIEYEIRKSYALLVFLESKADVLAEKLRILDALEEMAKSVVRSGNGKLSNVLFVERSRESVEADLGLLRKKMEQPTIAINRWLGRAWDTKIEVVDDVEGGFEKEGILEFARNGHPQHGILDDRVEVSDARIELTRYASKPKIGVGLDYAYIDGRSDVDIPGNGRDVLMPMGSISIPLHTGRYKAARQEEAIQKEAIEAYRKEVTDGYLSEIDMAYTVVEYAEDVEKKYMDLKEITLETLKLMRTEYASEGSRFEELLRLEMEMVEYDQKILDAQLEKNLAKATLNKYR